MLSTENKIKDFTRYIGLIFVIGISLWIYAANATGGMLVNRYANKNAAGITKKDISTGRVKIFKSELGEFLEHPFFGIGVGSGKFYREDRLDKEVASHNEISRLLGEHGMIGLGILFLLIVVPLKNMKDQPPLAKAFLGSFFIFWFLTINHSAMRIAFPGFIYGLSLITLQIDEENTVYR